MPERDEDEEQRGFFVESYTNRFGEPRFTEEAYGYWLFLAGAVLVTLGLAFFFVSTFFDRGQPNYRATRQASGFLTGLGLPTLMLGVVYRLPVKRTVDRIALSGAGICVLGSVLFVIYFPNRWDIPADSVATDMTGSVTLLYLFGVLVVVVSALLVSVVTETRGTEEQPQEAEAEFEIFKDEDENWRWNLRNRNGDIIADSTEAYPSKQKAKQGIEKLRNDAGGTPVTNREKDREPHSDTEEKTDSQAKYEIYEDEREEWRWRLKTPNGRTVADSRGGYGERRDAEASIGKVRAKARDTDSLSTTKGAFELYREGTGEWEWRFVSKNGSITARSEGHAERKGAVEAIESIQDGEVTPEVYEDDSGKYHWRLTAPDGETVADSPRGYEDESTAREKAEGFEEIAPQADTPEEGKAYFSVHKDPSGEWVWRFVFSNGTTVAESPEGYSESEDAIEALETLKEYATAPAG